MSASLSPASNASISVFKHLRLIQNCGSGYLLGLSSLFLCVKVAEAFRWLHLPWPEAMWEGLQKSRVPEVACDFFGGTARGPLRPVFRLRKLVGGAETLSGQVP